VPTLPNDAPSPQPADEVEALGAQYLAQLQAGEQPNREAILRTHPHLGFRLERRLAFAEMVFQVGLAPQPDEPSATEHGGAPDSNLDQTESEDAGEAKAPARSPANPPDYEILTELGHGGMGVVYKARQQSLNRIVAVKMIRAGAHASPDLLARFHIEAEALASLQHPNIIQIYEVGAHDGCPFMAMEFVAGGTLEDHLAAQLPTPQDAAGLVETLAHAMHAAHQRGIVHRDLKPANILLQMQNAECRMQNAESGSGDSFCILHSAFCIPKITDFGLAKRLAEDKSQTSTGVILGTPSYMAPEQAAGRAREIGPHTDVYSLGAILYRMLTGQPPFQEESALATLKRVESEEPAAPSRLGRRPPRDLETICLKCLEKEPTKRYGTARELAEDLRRFLDGVPTAARPAGMGERAWKWTKRRPTLAALIGVSVLAALTLAGVGISWSVQVRAERDRARQNLRVARQAIDDFYTKMASERLFDEPRFDPLCQDLLEKARTLYEELAQEHSDDPDVRYDIAMAWFRLGEIYRMRGRQGQAVQAYGEAIARQEQLYRDNLGEPRYRRDLANSHNWLGELLRESGRPSQEAERHYHSALVEQQRLVDQFPKERSYRMELARSHYNLGIVEKDTNRLTEAQTDFNWAVDLLTQLYGADTRDPFVRQDLARALIDRGVLHRLAGRPKKAGQDYNRAIALLARLRDNFPGRAAYKLELAVAWQDRGNLYWSQGRYADAQREDRQALAVLRELVANFPGRPLYKKKLANGVKDLGTAVASAKDKRGAEKYWQEARTLFEELVKDDPRAADDHGLLGMTLGYLGWLRTEEKDWPAARRLIEKSIAQLRVALQVHPAHPDYRPELRNQYQNLSWTLVQLGKPAGAVTAATQLASVFPDRAQDSYNAACFIARSVPLALDEKAARRYVEQAVSLLRKAAGKASPTLKRIKDEDMVFQPLAAHPKFRAAMRKLEDKVRPGQSTP
jgi:serine/threonine protein kinase